MCGRDVQRELLDQPRESRSLSLRKLQHQPGQGGGVDDWVLERTFQAPTHQPRVKRVVAVLDQNRAMSEAQEGPAGVSKLRCADEHRTVDVVAPVGVWVNGRLAVDKRVEER
jgi:hypothetical protein